MPMDYSPLDQPQVLRSLFYPQRTWLPASPGIIDLKVPVAPGIAVSGRFYPMDQAAPTILMFHGNGEVACQYDGLAPYYHNAGVNLCVMDYRGYGLSDGSPSIAAMMDDARGVFTWTAGFLAAEHYSGALFVKGRSLGSQPALEIAACFQEGLAGMIIESGFAGAERLFARFGGAALTPAVAEVIRQHRAKLAAIRLPLLVVHGEEDDIVPIELAMDLHESVGSADKEMLVVPGAGHNDLLYVDMPGYFRAVQSLVARCTVTGI